MELIIMFSLDYFLVSILSEILGIELSASHLLGKLYTT
jgi:hypothetical protein